MTRLDDREAEPPRWRDASPVADALLRVEDRLVLHRRHIRHPVEPRKVLLGNDSAAQFPHLVAPECGRDGPHHSQAVLRVLGPLRRWFFVGWPDQDIQQTESIPDGAERQPAHQAEHPGRLAQILGPTDAVDGDQVDRHSREGFAQPAAGLCCHGGSHRATDQVDLRDLRPREDRQIADLADGCPDCLHRRVPFADVFNVDRCREPRQVRHDRLQLESRPGERSREHDEQLAAGRPFFDIEEGLGPRTQAPGRVEHEAQNNQHRKREERPAQNLANNGHVPHQLSNLQGPSCPTMIL